MKHFKIHAFILIHTMIILNACATYQAQKVGPTAIMRAQQEIAEDQLMDVGGCCRLGQRTSRAHQELPAGHQGLPDGDPNRKTGIRA